MVIKIVIGSNFGDEGKGLMTDYFCHQAALRGDSCLVVLHNGGSQRGHTVELPYGERHVFHHFGSGTMVSSHTYCTKDFILNPMSFRSEWEKLYKLGITPRIYIHPLCRITTPFDMMINQIIEESRNLNRHGSCGMGIYETLIRDICNYPAIQWSHSNVDEIRQYLVEIRDKYLYQRIQDMTDNLVPREWLSIIQNPSLIEHFLQDLLFMFNHTTFSDESILCKYQTLVFENGQGLLLDQNNKEYFPHLTPSNTGIKNPFEIIKKYLPDYKTKDIEVCYVTRSYLTRHGAGRLDFECTQQDLGLYMDDKTNIPNFHQGSLRYAPLNVVELAHRIAQDIQPYDMSDYKISLSVTHMNERDITDDILGIRDRFDCIYISSGMDRNFVDELK